MTLKHDMKIEKHWHKGILLCIILILSPILIKWFLFKIHQCSYKAGLVDQGKCLKQLILLLFCFSLRKYLSGKECVCVHGKIVKGM